MLKVEPPHIMFYNTTFRIEDYSSDSILIFQIITNQ